MGFSACVVDETDFPSELDGILDCDRNSRNPSAQLTLPDSLIWLDEEGHVDSVIFTKTTQLHARK